MSSKAAAFFRPVPVDSPVHRLGAETKVVSGVVISIGLVFNPNWPNVGVAAALVVGVFFLARLPRSIIPTPPLLVRYGLIGGAMGATFSGGDPVFAGFGLGGLLDFLRLISVGIVMILWAGILSWTTGLTAVGFAVRRMIRPLRHLKVPVDEIGTVIALAVRALPLVADEVEVVNESVTTRPAAADLAGKPIRESFAFIGDTATAVVIGSHRRARDLAMAMASRGSVSAPEPPRPRFRKIDIAVILVAFSLCITAFLIPDAQNYEKSLLG